MNILIIAGGTGSIALQEGLFYGLDKRFDGFDIKVLVNAYDNGLSTGAVRKVLGGAILGPSDVRKNQTTRLKLENKDSPWLKLLDVRFTAETKAARDYCLKELNALNPPLEIYEAIDAYFSSPLAGKIDYTDFSLANIIYAGLCKMNGNSLRRAASAMASHLNIKDNVILNDDTSLFLGAVTKSGKKITDEGDIVSWGNKEDPFIDVFFTDHRGNEKSPVLCDEAKEAILDADLIILSSGTQWSSLIPTYASVGFKECVKQSKARIMMIMNRQPDRDSPGQTGLDIISAIVPKYFEPGRIELILDSTGSPQLNQESDELYELVKSVNVFNLDSSKQPNGNKPTLHSALKLFRAVGAVYFNQYLNSNHFMFDYDDTLVGRGNALPLSSAFNKSNISKLNDCYDVSICTGNSIKAVVVDNTVVNDSWFDYANSSAKRFLRVFADGGINEYAYNLAQATSEDAIRHELVGCADASCLFKDYGAYSAANIMETLNDYGIPMSKLENRGNATISIKPVDEEYRQAIISLVKLVLGNDSLFKVKATGRTTIDICHPNLSKAAAVKSILKDNEQVLLTYVGDELDNGNDAVIREMNDKRVRCLNVKSPAETAFFIQTLLTKDMTYDY